MPSTTSPSVRVVADVRGTSVQEKADNQITLFIRDEKTGRYAFNALALKALGLDPSEVRERGYPLKEPEESELNMSANCS